MSAQALSHLRVLDLTHSVAGPYCAKLLAGFGAEVIKVEPPGTGDRMRAQGPFFQNQPGVERSIPFLWLNTGKKSITLNLEIREGIDIIKELVQHTDLVVENFPPGFMSRLGLSYDTLRHIKVDLVMTSISHFGQTGPYRDYQAEESTEYALSGMMYVTGDPQRSPLASGPLITQYTAGMHAYFASLLALFRRSRSGQGAYIDLSMQESALENIEVILAEYLHFGKIAQRKNDKHDLVPWELYPCQDGYAAVIGGPVRKWLPAVKLFEAPGLLDMRYQHMAGRMRYREEVASLMQPWLSRHQKQEVYHAGQARGLAFGYLATLAEVLESPQHRAREYFVEVDHPVVGKHKYCGAPFRPLETPWQAARAPLLGEHNEAIYGDGLGYPLQEMQRLRAEGVI